MLLKISRVVVISVLTLFTFIPVLPAQSINRDRMQRDLEIMEGILDDLFSQPVYEISEAFAPVIAGGFSSRGAQGLYFDEYGVVFQMDVGGLHVIDFVRVRAEKELDEVRKRSKSFVRSKKQGTAKAVPLPDESVIIMGSEGARRDGEGVSFEKRLERLKTKCTDFLGDYADAIGQLAASDKITILINFDQARYFTVGIRSKRDLNNGLSRLEITAKKKDIIDYRKNKINRKTFEGRIKVTERKSDAQQNRNIDIMAKILDTALKQRHRNQLPTTHSNRGIYLEGLGAIFFLKSELFSNDDIALFGSTFEKYLKAEKASVGERKVREHSDKKVEEAVERIKGEIVELVGDYGHTLRTLKPAEYVVINLDFGRTRWGFSLESPRQLIVKIKKKVLDQYDRGEIKLATLEKNVVFMEY